MPRRSRYPLASGLPRSAIVAIAVPIAMLFVVVSIVVARLPRDVFDHDVGNVRSVLARELPMGSTYAAVEHFVGEHFQTHAWDPASRCLSAEYFTNDGGGRSSTLIATRSIQVHFFFDGSGLLVDEQDHAFMFREPLISPAQRERDFQKLLSNDPYYRAATQSLAETSAILHPQSPKWTIVVTRQASTKPAAQPATTRVSR